MWTFLQNWGARLMTLVVFGVLGRQLEASAFGLMAMGVAIVEFGRVLVDQGFSRSIVQRAEVDDAHLDTAFWTALGSGTVLTVLAALASPLVARGFGEPDLAPVLRVLSLSFLLVSLSTTQSAILRRRLDFRPIAARNLISVAAGGVVGVVAALSGAGVWALVAQHLTIGVMSVLVLWTVSPWRPSFRFSRDRFGDMFAFGTTTLGIDLVGYLARRGDDIIVGAFLGPAALGFFNVAYRVLQILMEVFMSTINAVAFPVFSRLQGDPERVKRALHIATRTSSALAFPAFGALALLAPEVITVVFGDGWGRSATVLQVVALLGLLRSVTFFNSSLLMGLGKAAWELGWVTFFVATKLVALLIGLQWGLLGVTWAIVIHGYVVAPGSLWLVNRANPIGPAAYLRQFARPLAACVVMIAVVYPLERYLSGNVSDASTLAVAGVVGLGTYGAALRVIAPSLTRELVGDARRVLGRR